jgi:hypothetical protein
MTHTPGPWVIAPHPSINAGDDWRTVVTLERGIFGPRYVGEALLSDALLIAAAPELLAALRNIVMNDDGSPIAHIMASIARTAIAKATEAAQ